MRLNIGFPTDAFASVDAEREGWERYRDESIARIAKNRPGRRPWAFWEYDVPAERDPRGDFSYGPEWVAEYLADIRDRVAYLAQEGALTADEIEAIRNPHRRADGEMHDQDRAALDGLDGPHKNAAWRNGS